MKTFIVPCDFSDTSKNAALYAVQLAGNIQDSSVILINAMDVIVAGADGTPLHVDDDSRQQLSLWALENVKKSLPIPTGVTVTCDAFIGTIKNDIDAYAIKYHADMIIMGITGSTRLDQVFIGSTTLNVISNAKTPVMIIPPLASYKGIKNVVLTSDFKEVEKTTPFNSLIKLLKLFKPKLHIVNVDSEHYVELTDEYKKERIILEEKLIGYSPEFSFVRSYDFIEGINQYVDTRNIDMLITLPKKHNFLSQLFKTSHTKKLAYHSHVPIIAIHD